MVVANGVPSGGALEISRKDFEQSIERPVDIVFPFDAKLAAQAAKLGKPMAEVASGKIAAPFNTLSTMVLSNASEEGAAPEGQGRAGAKSLVDNLKSMLTKPKAQGRVSDRIDRAASARCARVRGEGTMLLLIILVGGFGALLLAFMAVRGPSASKSLKRRIELIKERHGDVIAGNAQAQIRKLFAQRASRIEGYRLDPDPEAGAAAQAPGDDRQGHRRSPNMR